MKLYYRIITHLSVFLIVIMTVWAILFYMAIIDEVNDEIDDSLEDYSEVIILRSLAGEELPSKDSGSNNQYFLSEVTEAYAGSVPHIRYRDSMVYIVPKRETEPARILSTIFRNDEGRYFELTVSTPTIEKKDLKEAILYWIIFLYVSLLIVIILVNIWVYYRSTRPLYVLLHWLDAYKVGKKNEPLRNETDITEFRKLNQSVTDSMERVEKAFDNQKQFIGNASHELQTPLAVIMNRVEMLMDDDSIEEEQMTELLKIQQTLEYIVRLNKSLLLLSKIDNKQFQDAADINVNALVRKFLPDYRDVYEYLDICATVKESGTFIVRMNESLASILVNNLIKNSYVHNVQGGRVEIDLAPGSVTFRNSGCSYPLNPNLIYERFYQGSKKEGSTGLGLTIVKSICDMERLSLQYAYAGGMHCFSISRESRERRE